MACDCGEKKTQNSRLSTRVLFVGEREGENENYQMIMDILSQTLMPIVAKYEHLEQSILDYYSTLHQLQFIPSLHFTSLHFCSRYYYYYYYYNYNYN